MYYVVSLITVGVWVAICYTIYRIKQGSTLPMDTPAELLAVSNTDHD
jgi:hypothetical protein